MHVAHLKRARPFQAIAALVDVVGRDKMVLIRPDGSGDDPPTLLRLAPAMVLIPDAHGRLAPVGSVSAAQIDGVYLRCQGHIDAGHELMGEVVLRGDEQMSVPCAAKLWTPRPCPQDDSGLVRLVGWRLAALVINPMRQAFEEARLWLREFDPPAEQAPPQLADKVPAAVTLVTLSSEDAPHGEVN